MNSDMEYQKQYYQRNKEKRNDYTRQWYQKNKEKQRFWNKKYYQNHKEYFKQYRQENKVKKTLSNLS